MKTTDREDENEEEKDPPSLRFGATRKITCSGLIIFT